MGRLIIFLLFIETDNTRPWVKKRSSNQTGYGGNIFVGGTDFHVNHSTRREETRR